MEWLVFLIASAVILIACVGLAVFKAKVTGRGKRLLDPSKMLFVGVVLSAIVLFIPIYINTFKNSDCGIFETILVSIHNMIRLFVVDGEFSFVTSNLEGVSPVISRCYTILFAILFVLAPILTFGFVLSFFKNVSAYKRFITHYNSNAFVFSKLNEKSLTLAESLYENKNKGRFFIFADVYDTDEEQNGDLIERAKAIGAVWFQKDMASIDFSAHSKKSDLSFFAIGDDQSENINKALKIVEKLKYRENTNLYVFSTQLESEILMSGAFNDAGDDIKIRVRRVNEVQSLIYRNLYENGYDNIFCAARDDGSGIKKINAVVVGMGQYGVEMTKSLSWFTQMDRYLAEINVFDADPKAGERFASLCPELMEFSGKLDIKGESRYTINIHSGVDVDTLSFDKFISSLPEATYVFVALGEDEKNISAAVKLRSLYEKLGNKPVIQAVVCNSEKKEALFDAANFKGQKYNIDFIGDMKTSYSEKVILGSDVEEQALRRHTKWGRESDFWRYNYNYKSSMASAIHRKMKILCGIAGSDKDPSERTESELWALRILEHCRWNAYMRSEGYVYGGTVEKSGRNDLAKMHNCLVPFDELPLEEQIKDDN